MSDIQPDPYIDPIAAEHGSEWDWEAEAAEREQYADVMAADLADQRHMDRQAGQ